ncbi:MAG: serine/threonine-protein phosphatase [Lachnospiraceae bacterium]|nr:serine/threonine-protein phosphatase [Lachnospiraceae bacterium]
MNFRIKKAALTDIGAKKRVNQDAILVRAAKSRRFGPICFALVCDGLGGLALGEVASSAFKKRMDRWFVNDIPPLIRRAEKENFDSMHCLHRVRLMWQSIFMEMNESIARYGHGQGIRLGTTAVAFLLIGQQYLVMHVGDSRLYLTGDNRLLHLTHDHSLVQKQLDAGILTPSQAGISDKKSILLQCIGASHVVRPDFRTGTICQDTSVLLCSDGFWRRLHDEEILDGIRINQCLSETEMQRVLRRLTSSVKQRGERDNISAILLCLYAEVTIPVLPAFHVGTAAVC